MVLESLPEEEATDTEPKNFNQSIVDGRSKDMNNGNTECEDTTALHEDEDLKNNESVMNASEVPASGGSGNEEGLFVFV